MVSQPALCEPAWAPGLGAHQGSLSVSAFPDAGMKWLRTCRNPRESSAHLAFIVWHGVALGASSHHLSCCALMLTAFRPIPWWINWALHHPAPQGSCKPQVFTLRHSWGQWADGSTCINVKKNPFSLHGGYGSCSLVPNMWPYYRSCVCTWGTQDISVCWLWCRGSRGSAGAKPSHQPSFLWEVQGERYPWTSQHWDVCGVQENKNRAMPSVFWRPESDADQEEWVEVFQLLLLAFEFNVEVLSVAFTTSGEVSLHCFPVPCSPPPTHLRNWCSPFCFHLS